MIVYPIGKNVYINLTNRCSNLCDFCVRTASKEYEGYSLWLSTEPTAEEVIKALAEYPNGEEYVFCGYGEPLYRLEELLTVATHLKERDKKVRLNTNGQADRIVGEGVAERLKGSIDTVSISLNAVTAEQYQAVCHSEFGTDGYYSMLRFAASCVKAGIRTVLSVVDIIGGENIEKAKEMAQEMGAVLRVRDLLV